MFIVAIWLPHGDCWWFPRNAWMRVLVSFFCSYCLELIIWVIQYSLQQDGFHISCTWSSSHAELSYYCMGFMVWPNFMNFSRRIPRYLVYDLGDGLWQINVVLEELGTLTSPRSGGPASNELSRQVDTFGDILRMPQRNGESAWVQYRKIIVTFSSCLNRLQNRRLEAKKVFADTLKMTRAAAAFIQSGNLGSSTNEGGVADPTENIYVQAMLAKASFLNKDKRENRAVLPRAIKTHSPTSSGTTSPTKRASQGESPLSPYSPGVSFNESPTENRRRSQAPPRSSLSPKRGRNNETGGLTVILDDEDANR